jgi:hypothetical protein
MVLSYESLSRDIFTLHKISMVYLYNKFRTSGLKRDPSVYGLDSLACLSYDDEHGLIIKKDGSIVELPESYFPQGLVNDITARISHLGNSKN